MLVESNINYYYFKIDTSKRFIYVEEPEFLELKWIRIKLKKLNLV